MSSFLSNVVVLALCWLLVTGVGVYVTYVRQPETLEQLKKAEQVARMSQAEFTTLRVEEQSTREMADDALRRWSARYKVIPSNLSSPEVIGQLNDLTQRGFKNFDVVLDGVINAEDFKAYRFTITGTGYFSSLYRFIWDVENSRQLFRIHNLKLSHVDRMEQDRETGKERMEVLVSFTMQLEAYFGSLPDMSRLPRPSDDGLVTDDQGLPVIPAHVLPERQPTLNPFFPIVMENLPPNTYDLVDVETDELVGLTGEGAIFKRGDAFRVLQTGDDVYLGKIIEVDLVQQRVVARLNKGGIVDEVEVHLQTGDRYRQALGTLELAPLSE
ncbi:hypothetical protein AWN76_007385 [Rhodothermaceae bacterium RA]|nr:hypothetical protein AWN76_007385 [Rhodothermaceae bacterium RA]